MMRRPILSAGRQHLHLWCGVWSCVTLEETPDRIRWWRVGCGYSWRDAYADWKAQQ